MAIDEAQALPDQTCAGARCCRFNFSANKRRYNQSSVFIAEFTNGDISEHFQHNRQRLTMVGLGDVQRPELGNQILIAAEGISMLFDLPILRPW